MKHSYKSILLASILSLLICASAFAIENVVSFGSNPGNLKMYRHVPSDMPANAPLVVVLHGCSQSASSYNNDTEWDDLADRKKFYVVYAQTDMGNNIKSCFNWFDPADYGRDRGEAQSIMSMINKMKSDYSIDNGRVFITGVSAGGVMAANMMASYPDVFAGGGINAGIPSACTNSIWGASGCMNGINKTPQQWGNEVRDEYPGYSGPYPVLSVFHGTADPKVNISNANELMEQWTNVHATDQTPEVDETFRGQSHKVYEKDGSPVVEVFIMSGMEHGITVDPGSGEDEGGNTGPNSFDEDIWSSYYIAKFWGLVDGGTPPDPFVNITSPSNGSVVSGVVTITANANGIDTSEGVEFFINDSLTCTDTSVPYSCSWDTAAVADGSYSLKAVATDAASGDPLVDDDTSVTVNNTVPACEDWYASNYSHVMDGRAYVLFGFVYANGSNESMGLFNIFTYNWLRQTSPGYYEIGNCP